MLSTRYGLWQDLVKRTQSNKVFKNKVFKIASNGYQIGLASMKKRFLIKNPLRLINLVKVVSLINQIINWKMNFINQLLKNFKKEKFIRLLETISVVLI